MLKSYFSFLYYYSMLFIHEVSLKGKRDTNQDRICVTRSNKEIIIGIYDGHGDKGDQVSTYLQEHFIDGSKKLNQKAELQEYIYNVQNKLKHFKDSGSTLLVMKINIFERKTLTINLGDCRALITYDTKPLQLTNDHKVDDQNERLRLIGKKRNVEYDEEDEIFRVDGYAISRAMGNTKFSSISQKAEINFHRFPKNTEYIILGCDGLYDCMTNKEINKFVSTHKKINSNENKHGKKNVAYLLAKEAIKKGSQDNVSVVIVFFVSY